MYANVYGYGAGNVYNPNTGSPQSQPQAQAQAPHHQQSGRQQHQHQQQQHQQRQQHQQQHQQQQQQQQHQQQQHQQQQQQQHQQHQQHHQQQHHQQQHHQQQPNQKNQPQQVMFSSQQYGEPSCSSQLSPYGSVSNGNSQGLSSNNSLSHISSGSGVPSYQTPYSSSPYSASGSIPVSSAATLPNFMPSLGASPVYGIGITNANLHLQPQRNQSNPNLSTPAQSNSRSSHIPSGQYSSSPTSTMLSQFSTPQVNTQNSPAAISGQAIPSVTPQTPNFPPSYNAQSGSTMISPLSPDPEACEKERVKILLKINKELLLEVIRLQSVHNEAKEDVTSIPTNLELPDKEKSKGPAFSRYYFECMRRLQANLAYLAARTDRSKSSNHLPTHPQIMSAPILISSNYPPSQGSNASPSPESSRDNEDTEADVDRLETLKEYYKSLQALFPSVDIRKDSLPNTTGRVQPQKHPILDQNVQQKMQNELLRQKIIQAQQAPQHHKQMSHSQQQQR